jgi:phage-related protein
MYHPSSDREINTDDVYGQFKSIRNELEKVKNANKQIKMIVSDHNDNIEKDLLMMLDAADRIDESQLLPETQAEKKYRFLIQPQTFRSRDAPNTKNIFDNELVLHTNYL